ncbi:MAG: anthranilate synthase component I family protein [Chthoniobacterales bacterium]
MNAIKKLAHLSFEGFLELAHQHDDQKAVKRVVVFQKIKLQEGLASLTPMALFEKLDFFLEGGSILESSLQEERTGRYSFLAFEPIGTYEAFHEEVRETIYGDTCYLRGDPLEQAPLFLKKFHTSCSPEIAPLVTQSIGFITYDAIHYMESIPDRHPRDEALPEFLLKVYQTTFCIDHQDQSLLITTLAALGEDHREAYSKAHYKIDKVIQHIIMTSNDRTAHSSCSTQSYEVYEKQDPLMEMSHEGFIALVKKAQEEIKKGEIFQIVLSRSVSKRTKLSAFSLYVALREVSPAPYLFYLPLADRVIMGASPERMLRISGKKITINPIAGTRPRITQDQDGTIEEELLADSKELAEHRMLVDLGRNDLGRVCKVGSVQVEEFLKITHYSHISHLTSQISGILRDEYDFWDALKATFPAGTLSGAPKIRAMELIDQFETSRRGLYGGAILRLDHSGDVDSCIAIRMLTLKEGVATIRTGAGIVYDSIPSHEAAETQHKAYSILAAIDAAEKKENDHDLAHR